MNASSMVRSPVADAAGSSEKPITPSSQYAPLVGAESHAPRSGVLRIGSVSFLNAKPLIYGLEQASDLQLGLDVPSRLLADLQAGRFDVALLPSIDYQRLDGLTIVPAGGIACDGPTLTVRIFSRVPMTKITQLTCDTDSHTSIALARILLKESFGNSPEFVDLSSYQSPVPVAGDASAARSALARDAQPEAMLLIGDKVVADEPAGYEYQLDFGQAWKDLTGLPFVFAVWMARPGVNLDGLMEQLSTARENGLRHIAEIVDAHGPSRRWPRQIAIDYLTKYLKFQIGPRQLQAIELFHQKAAAHGIIPAPARPLKIHTQG